MDSIWQHLAAHGIDVASVFADVGRMTFSARNSLGVLRAIVGVVSLVAPSASARLFGVAPEAGTAWITRLFGSRELVLAATLLAARSEYVSPIAAAGAGIDALDAASSVVELARGRISTYTFISGGCGAVLFALLGLATMRGARARQPS